MLNAISPVISRDAVSMFDNPSVRFADSFPCAREPWVRTLVCGACAGGSGFGVSVEKMRKKRADDDRPLRDFGEGVICIRFRQREIPRR